MNDQGNQNNKHMNVNLFAFRNIQKDHLKSLVDSIKQTSNGFAGFASREGLLNYVKDTVFSNSEQTAADLPKDLKDIETYIVHALKFVTDKYTASNDIEIYLFPTLSDQVKNGMAGVLGRAPYGNVIHLYIHKDVVKNKNLSVTIRNAVAHEYNHLMRYENFPKTKTLLDDLVIEGLAENFREDVFPSKPAPWASALSIDSAKSIFQKLKTTLQVKDYDFAIYSQIFFGSDEYEPWTGYSVGYYLVKDYLKTKSDPDWNKIMKIPAEQIATESGWL